MKEKYTVSELSRLFGISNQTLRYYDKIGLFKPNYVDKENNYRYYDYEQFFCLSMIMQLKRLNFSLESVQRYSSSMDMNSLEKNLIKTKELIHKQIEQLNQLESRNDRILQNLHIAKNAAEYQKCEVVEEPTRFQYAIPINFEIKDLYHYIKVVYESYIRSRYATHMAQHGEIVLQIHKENLQNRDFHVYNSIGFFIESNAEVVKGSREVVCIEQGKFATCVHCGPYGTIHRSYQKLYDFIEKQGWNICGDSLEFAVVSISLTKDPENFITQIQIPVQEGK